MRNLLVQAPAPFGYLVVPCTDSALPCDLPDLLLTRLPKNLVDCCYIAQDRQTITEEHHDGDVHIRLLARLRGGKGGFGSQLRAAGGRMKGNKKANTEAMKDVSGRRLRTLKKAEALAEALRDAPAREIEERKQKREKLMAILNTELPGRGGRQIKFDDEEYLAQSESILDDIKHALEQAYADGESDSDSDSEDQSDGDVSGTRTRKYKDVGSSSKVVPPTTAEPRRLQGWDDDEPDDFSGDDSSEDDTREQANPEHGATGQDTDAHDKGKAREQDAGAEDPGRKRRKTRHL